MTHPTIVIGAGITGLAAAHQLDCDGRDFMVLEASPRAGGKIDGGPVGPLDIDSAADGFLARQPEMRDLCVEVGLGDDLVAPAQVGAFIWANDSLRPIPAPSVLGVPLDADTVERSGIVSARGVAELREKLDRDREALVGDATVGEVLRPVIGDEVFERLVDPLLGGINAGSADRMSIAAGAPKIAEAARLGGSLRANLAAQAGEAARTPGPVFLSVSGGARRITERLAERLGNRLRTSMPVTSLRPIAGGWSLSTPEGPVSASKVILTTPAPTTAALLEPHCPEAAATLRGINYSSAVLVTFVIPREKLDNPLEGSGFLVPRDQGLLMTACSWSSSKWLHYDDGTHAVLRVSAGRTDDPRWLSIDRPALVDTLIEELKTTVGLNGIPTVRTTEWREALPQYTPGHLDRIDAVEAEIAMFAPGVTATGAAFRGLGLPTCVRQGRAAALA